jgi:hypothetical protein
MAKAAKSDSADQPATPDAVTLSDGTIVRLSAVVRLTPLDGHTAYELMLSAGPATRIRRIDGEKISALIAHAT